MLLRRLDMRKRIEIIWVLLLFIFLQSVSGLSIVEIFSNSSIVYSSSADLTISEGYAYVASYDVGVCLYNVSDPFQPIYMNCAEFNHNLSPQKIIKSGNYVYEAGDGAGCGSTCKGTHSLYVYDFSNKSTVNRSIYSYYYNVTNINRPRDIYKWGNYVFVLNSITAGSGNYPITILDVSNPSNITLVSRYLNDSTITTPHDMFVKGSYAYIVCPNIVTGGWSLNVFDISNIYNITQVFYYQNVTNLNSYVILGTGDYAYTVAYNGTISVFNIAGTNASSPVQVIAKDLLPSLIRVRRGFLYNDYIFIISFDVSEAVIAVINISNRINPVLVDSLSSLGNATLNSIFSPSTENGNYIFSSGGSSFVSFEMQNQSCWDGIQNQNETETDYGGVCGYCNATSGKVNDTLWNDARITYSGMNFNSSTWCVNRCWDGILNQDETEIDYGGVCGYCNATSGKVNDTLWNAARTLFPYQIFDNTTWCGETCWDNRLNQNETEIDYGGICGSCGNYTKVTDTTWQVWHSSFPGGSFNELSCNVAMGVEGGTVMIIIIITAMLFIVFLIISLFSFIFFLITARRTYKFLRKKKEDENYQKRSGKREKYIKGKAQNIYR